MKPRYQEVPAAKIPIAKTPDGSATVKVLAGEALGARAVIDTRTPILYLDAALEPGAKFFQPVPADFNVFAYVVEGSGTFGADARPAGDEHIVLFGSGGDGVLMDASADEPLRVLLIGGRPLSEPIARYGPFVMNTRSEIHQAVEDFQSGRFGEIPPDR
jgi:redox-sensitive bicupin YhaK (pirin superfamily)